MTAPRIDIVPQRADRKVRSGTGATRTRRTLTSRWYGLRVDGALVERLEGAGLDTVERTGRFESLARARVIVAGIETGSIVATVIA